MPRQTAPTTWGGSPQFCTDSDSVIVCSVVWRCEFKLVDIQLSVDVFMISCTNVTPQRSLLWDVMYDTVVLAQIYCWRPKIQFLVLIYLEGMLTKGREFWSVSLCPIRFLKLVQSLMNVCITSIVFFITHIFDIVFHLIFCTTFEWRTAWDIILAFL